MNPPKVAYITNVRLPAQDAQSKQIFSMARAFQRVLPEGHFCLISPAFADQRDQGFAWKRIRLPIQRARLRYLCFFLIQPWVLFRGRYDVVFTRDILIALMAVLCGCRVFYEIHKAAKPGAALVLRVLRHFRSARFICISHALKTYLNESFGIAVERMQVNHDAVDAETFGKLRQIPKAELRAELGLPTQGVVVVHTGSIGKNRGFGQVESLLKTHYPFTFVQVGGQPADIAYWKDQFRSYSNVVFTGPLPQQTVFRYQVAADLGLFFITREAEVWWCSSPLKIFEYLAAGTPILASTIGSVSEVLNDQNSIGFDPDKPESLLQGFVAFMENPLRAKEMAETALTQPNLILSWEERCQSILAFDASYLSLSVCNA